MGLPGGCGGGTILGLLRAQTERGPWAGWELSEYNRHMTGNKIIGSLLIATEAAWRVPPRGSPTVFHL